VSERDNSQLSERERNIRVQILEVAKQLIAGQVGVIAASRQLSHLRHEVEPRVAEVLLTFTGIDSETDALPIGRVRKEWNQDALKVKDREIEDAERFYRDSAMSAAAELIRLLDVPS
jgi:hypothetical protein